MVRATPEKVPFLISIMGVMATSGNLGLSIAALAAIATKYSSSSFDTGAELLAVFFVLTLPPAALALYGSLRTKPLFLLLAFVTSLPFSFYFWCFIATGIYKYRGIFDLFYLVSGIAMAISLKVLRKEDLK
ncbi:hypothetical protein Adeg_1169 [Ammonifex degensii KC4]|uniref:Uncharacterized protein n=1 Tax=Ammonifex degensii (strain DSM 10501 / KC4) TaxID=429009 RepID=C9RDF8_AMMDK|nr:hypothetical protein [Ammonifex degensii]ACX52285.1 hypothetical protein Adeg_1169 [Ammonifex degensii KC4]